MRYPINLISLNANKEQPTINRPLSKSSNQFPVVGIGASAGGLDAFKKTEAFKKNKKIAGFTPLQRYFLGYALGWMYQERKERLANQVMTDVHAPAKERVNGPVVNIPEFYEAFGIKPGDKMYRPDSLRVNIW